MNPNTKYYMAALTLCNMLWHLGIKSCGGITKSKIGAYCTRVRKL